MTAPRVYYAMARDGLFFHRLSVVHPRFRTPAFAVLAGSAWAAVLAATGTFEQLLTYVVFSGWIFYALGAATIFIYRRRDELESPYRVPGYPWTPLLFILAAAAASRCHQPTMVDATIRRSRWRDGNECDSSRRGRILPQEDHEESKISLLGSNGDGRQTSEV